MAHEVVWARSTRCDSGHCVEVARSQTRVAMRDSKDPNGVHLVFSPDDWRAFLGAVRTGQFG